MTMAKLIKVAETKDLPPGSAAAFEVEGQSIALFNVAGTFYAIDDTCPHSGGPLSQGQVEGAKVTFSWHEANFELSTGKGLCGPAFENFRSYKVVVEGNEIKVEV